MSSHVVDFNARNKSLRLLRAIGIINFEKNKTHVYKFKKIVGRVDFCDQFRKIIVRYKRIGYNINIMRQMLSV